MIRHPARTARRGIAATEMAITAPVLIILLVGTWEVGRMIMVQNQLHEAAREGGRLAGSAAFFASNNHANPLGGTLSLIPPSTNGPYEVQQKMIVNMQAAGLNTEGVTITITNLGNADSPKNWSYVWSQTTGGNGSGYDPAAAADQLDSLLVTVTMPYKNVAWSPLNMFVSENATLSATIKWVSMRDIPLQISTVIPTQPLQSSDPLP